MQKYHKRGIQCKKKDKKNPQPKSGIQEKRRTVIFSINYLSTTIVFVYKATPPLMNFNV